MEILNNNNLTFNYLNTLTILNILWASNWVIIFIKHYILATHAERVFYYSVQFYKNSMEIIRDKEW